MSRQPQRDRILELLVRAQGSWVGLPQILDLHIGQYNARILELRGMGHTIENKTERDSRGEIHSWYRLVPKYKQMSFDELLSVGDRA